MKFVLLRKSLLGLGMSAIALLFSQQVLAVGTPAGDTISNLATVNYDVNGNAQTLIESSPGGNAAPGATLGTSTDFVVDARVNFTLTEVSGDVTTVTPGQTGALVEFLLTNTGNTTQDFLITPTDEVDGTQIFAAAYTDNINIGPPLTAMADNNGNSTPEPGTDPNYVDDLAADIGVTVWVSADAAVGMTNAQVAAILLTAVAAVDGTPAAPGVPATSTGGGDTAGVDVVLAVGGTLGNGTLTAQDGYEVESASLLVSKTSTIQSDPFNGATDPKHIPGATVRFVISVDNSGGTQDATDVVVTDPLTNVTVTGLVNVDDGSGSGPYTCTADATATDGCSFAAGVLSVGNVSVPLNVLAGDIATITFDVLID